MTVYIICQPDRARPAFDIVSRAIEGHAGVAANSGKTRVFTRAGGPAPPGVKRSALMCGAVVTAQSVAWSP